jgi:predicted transcriptional regulator
MTARSSEELEAALQASLDLTRAICRLLRETRRAMIQRGEKPDAEMVRRFEKSARQIEMIAAWSNPRSKARH